MVNKAREVQNPNFTVYNIYTFFICKNLYNLAILITNVYACEKEI